MEDTLGQYRLSGDQSLRRQEYLPIHHNQNGKLGDNGNPKDP
jgi:hypothetical protein